MDKSISATEAARNFSELLNLVKFGQERYTILRGGKPVASLGPAPAVSHQLKGGDLLSVLRQLPSLGDEAIRFERDLNRSRRKAPGLPKGPVWE